MVCERHKKKGAWQFPQGGVDEGEKILEALFREVEEEIGLKRSQLEIISERGGYRYDYLKVRDKKYIGQEQTYFLLKFTGKDKDVSLKSPNHKQEFQAWKWIDPGKFERKWIPDFKISVYRAVLKDFFDKKLFEGKDR